MKAKDMREADLVMHFLGGSTQLDCWVICTSERMGFFLILESRSSLKWKRPWSSEIEILCNTTLVQGTSLVTMASGRLGARTCCSTFLCSSTRFADEDLMKVTI